LNHNEKNNFLAKSEIYIYNILAYLNSFCNSLIFKNALFKLT
jgi:hypothetical protein